MIEHERKMQALDIIVVVILIIIGYVAGKLVMTHVSDTWLGVRRIDLVAGQKTYKMKWEED